ncbi:S100 calcium binding protein U [Anarrhichthys ocellatus]|uniref:S100 calcium binding protein U n=1 Tax=Anarrhichthys ocellatus TaxID=433405 RepID=UPI0012EDDDE5|nr:retinitis pigmentosa 1-like 1 protein [Anarrhichthys ocellatus]
MESAIQTMVKVFIKSTKGKESLGQGQFQSLVKNQLSNILTDTDSKEAIKNMGQGLDANHDGKVGFEEYLQLVGYLAVSRSEQRNLAKKEPAQNAASEPVEIATGPEKEEAKPEAKEEAKPQARAEEKEEDKPEAKEEAKPEANNAAKVEAAAEVKVEENVGETVEIKSEGETQPEAAMSEEEKAKGLISMGEVDLPVCTRGEPGIMAPEMEIPRLEEEVEKKIEEATS